MSDNVPLAGWYPDGGGAMRWWDRQRWSDDVQSTPATPEEMSDSPPTDIAATNPAEEAMTATTAQRAVAVAQTAQPLASPAPAQARDPWYRKRWVIAFGAAIVGLSVGAASATSNPKDSSEYKAEASKLEKMTASRDAYNSKRAPLEAAVSKVDDREKGLDDRESSLKARENQVRTGAAAVRKREMKVGIVETDIKNNTLDGDGAYEVGKDIKAGTDRTKGGADCYYAVLNDTKGDLSSIVTNNNISGIGIVTVGGGQFLELSGCNEWVKH